MMLNKPYSESCEQNRVPIFQAIAPLLANCEKLLEIGSGTGQHAVYFAAELPNLIWQTSDRQRYHQGIVAWLDEAQLANTRAPLKLDVRKDAWPTTQYDAIFSANTLHIMHKAAVEALFTQLPNVLKDNGLFIVYGAFNHNGHYTSASNERFDQWLHAQDPQSGIKDFEWVNQLAEKASLRLHQALNMPANNELLCWQKIAQ